MRIFSLNICIEDSPEIELHQSITTRNINKGISVIFLIIMKIPSTTEKLAALLHIYAFY